MATTKKAVEKITETSEKEPKVTKKTEKVTKIVATKRPVGKIRRYIEKARASWNKKKNKTKASRIVLGTVELLAFCAWVWVSLEISKLALKGVIELLYDMGVDLLAHEVLVQTIFSALIYALSLAITISLPWLILGEKTTRDELGLRGLFTWTDIGLGVVGFIVAMIAASLLSMIAAAIFKWIDLEQVQEVGFSNLSGFFEMMLAFVTLVVIAPVCEEILFRGWLYGKLRARTWAMPAMILVAILFGIVHGQWNVGITVAAMSIVMCLIREMTGTIWGGMIVHMIKNGLAYYLLFVRLS